MYKKTTVKEQLLHRCVTTKCIHIINIEEEEEEEFHMLFTILTRNRKPPPPHFTHSTRFHWIASFSPLSQLISYYSKPSYGFTIKNVKHGVQNNSQGAVTWSWWPRAPAANLIRNAFLLMLNKEREQSTNTKNNLCLHAYKLHVIITRFFVFLQRLIGKTDLTCRNV